MKRKTRRIRRKSLTEALLKALSLSLAAIALGAASAPPSITLHEIRAAAALSTGAQVAPWLPR